MAKNISKGTFPQELKVVWADDSPNDWFLVAVDFDSTIEDGQSVAIYKLVRVGKAVVTHSVVIE